MIFKNLSVHHNSKKENLMISCLSILFTKLHESFSLLFKTFYQENSFQWLFCRRKAWPHLSDKFYFIDGTYLMLSKMSKFNI